MKLSKLSYAIYKDLCHNYSGSVINFLSLMSFTHILIDLAPVSDSSLQSVWNTIKREYDRSFEVNTQSSHAIIWDINLFQIYLIFETMAYDSVIFHFITGFCYRQLK